MPSLLGRIFGVSFRTELLIMNIFGLVNSTLDWSPLQWTSKLEKIWNLSIPQTSLIIDTIGEDTIKTVLSWIVITRIVIAHIYTFTYLSNIYPIITWSRPNFQLPWLILSFFKNVVLEVVVIVIGLLLWYGNPFSLVVFLEFIFLKLVPLVLACYNWYLNSCFFLQLRQIEKMKKLKRSMRSDSNLLTNQLYVKIDDPKYRTGSLSTLFSFDSYETYDARMTPGQNAKKLLGITEEDVKHARARVKEREIHKRLTALDDSDLGLRGREDSRPYFFSSSFYEDSLFFDPIRILQDSEYLKKLEDLENTDTTTGAGTLEGTEEKKNPGGKKYLDEESSEKKTSAKIDEIPTNKESQETHIGSEKITDPGIIKLPEKLKDSRTINNLEEEQTTAAGELARVKKEEAEIVETCSMCQMNDTNVVETRKETIEVPPTVPPLPEPIGNIEKNPSPVKLQTVFNCNCALDDADFKENHGSCCEPMDMRTSTPRSDCDGGNDRKEAKESPKKFGDQSYTYAYNVTNINTDFTMSSGFPLMENLLKNDLEILKSVRMDDEGGQKGGFVEDLSTMELRQIKEDMEMEKKWNLFAGQTNLETLLRAAFPREDHETNGLPTNPKITHPFIDDSLKLEEILGASGSSFLRSNNKEDNSPRLKIHGDYQFHFETPLRMENDQKPAAVHTTASVHTQTEETNISRISNRSLMDPKPRRKPLFRRKALKDQNGSASSVNSSKQHLPRKNYCPVYFKNTPSLRRSPSNDSKKLSLSKSSSNKSVCECKTQKLETRYFPEKDNSFNRREDSRNPTIKLKIDSLATLPLAQVTRQPEVNPITSKKKPPVYPKSFKKELESVVPNETTKRSIFGRKIETESKKSVDKKPANSPKTVKRRNRRKLPAEELEARELKALKAYNEITLMKDKKELEAKKKIANKEPANRTEDVRSSYKRNSQKNLKGKENLSVDATTETVISVSSSFKSNKSTINNAGRHVSGEKSFYSKSLKTSKIKDRILENFDRLYDNTREEVIADLHSKKEYIHYSLSQIRQIADVVVGSPSSSMTLEGARKGRNLERTAAKEDMREPMLFATADNAILEVRSEEQEHENIETIVLDNDRNDLNLAPGDIETEDKELLTVVEKPIKEYVSSIWSSSSIDEGGKSGPGVTESSCSDSQVQDLPKVEEEVAGMLDDLKSIVSSHSSKTERGPESVKPEMDQEEPIVSQDDREPRRTDLTDFMRNIEVINQGTGVILTNPNSPPSAGDRISTHWDIVDSQIVRRLNNALSYKSMDSLLDIPGEIRTVEGILNDTRAESANNEFTELFNDQLPYIPQQTNRFDSILATIQEAIGMNQSSESLDLCIITIDRTNLMNNSEIGDIEGNQEPITSETQLSDVLRAIAEVLRTLELGELDLETLSRSRFEILEDMIHGIEGETVENLQKETIDVQRNTEEQSLKEVEEIPRFIKEDIFTDIKFPIVIKRTEIDPDRLKMLYDSPLGLHLNPVVNLVEPVGLNFRGLTETTDDDDDDDEEEEEAEEVAGSSRKDFSLKEDGFGKDNEFLRYFDTQEQSVSGNENLSESDECNVEDYQSAVDDTVDKSVEFEYFSILGSPEFSEPALRRLMKENLNVTYDIIDMGSANEDVEEIDESEREGDKMGTWRNRYMYEIFGAEKSFESEELGECSEIKGNEDEASTEPEENVLCSSMEEDVNVNEFGDSEGLEESVREIVDEIMKVQARNEENLGTDETECISEFEGMEETDVTEKFDDTFSTEEIAGDCKMTPKTEASELDEIISASETDEAQFEEIETVCHEKEDIEEETANTDRNAEEQEVEDTITSTESQYFDKHEKEEDVKTGNSGEYIRIKEVEDGTKEKQIRRNIESVQITTNTDNTEEKEESPKVQQSCWIKPDIIIDYPDETDENDYEEIDLRAEKPKKVTISSNDEETNGTEFKERASFKTVLMFWLLVFYFYVRHFYRKICSPTQVSRTTSTLKPYDVHAVSTSTSGLLQKTSLLKKLQDGTNSEDSEELCESSVDFESMNISRAIEERLKVVLDLTTDRSISRSSEFGTEEMAEELRRETEELGLNASGCVAKETSSSGKVNEESLERKDLSVSELEEEINLNAAEEVRSFRFEELDQPCSSRSLLRYEVSSENIEVREATVKTEKKSVGESQERIVTKKLSLMVEENKGITFSEEEGRANEEEISEEKRSTMEYNEAANTSVEKSEDFPPIQFETTFNELDSFDSLYTRPSITSNTISFSKLDTDDMEEFSAASSTTSGEAT